MHLNLKKSPKRIVIIGSASVGKTTLFDKVKKILKLKVIPEQAREVCKKLGYKNLYQIPDPNIFRFFVLKEQIKKEEQYKHFISDRSTIDCFAYWIRWSWNKAKSYESEEYFNFAKKQALKYSHIIYIPRLIEPKEDYGFRWNDENYQCQMDRLFRTILNDWELMKRTYIIQSKNIGERVKEVMSFLTID